MIPTARITTEKEKMTEEYKLSVLGHLQDLRKRLLWMAVAIAVGTGVSFYFRQEIVDGLKTFLDEDAELQIIGMTEGIVTAFKLSVTCGLILAIPVILYEVVMFVRPALTKNEKKYLYTLMPAALLAFGCGATFAFFILLPPAISVLEKFGNEFGAVEWRAGDYVSTIIGLLFGIGLCFELPIVMYFLGKIGVITAGGLKRFHRWAIVLAFILAAIITPTPDPINQTLVAAPLILLYLLGTLLVWIAQKGRTSSVM